MLKELYENDAQWTILGLLVVFYFLQVHWWIKIVSILIRGPRKKDKEKSGDGSGDNNTNTKDD
jgi:hypothetical protein